VIEERFIDALLNIRSAVLSDSQADLDTIILQRITPLAQKLNITLSH
jgi:hypothetical protein